MSNTIVDIHKDLVEQCLEGRGGAFKALYDLYSRQMFSIAVRYLNDREEAEDVLQEAFTDAFKNLKSFRGDSSFGSWLKRIVVNKSLNRIKKRKLEFTDLTTSDPLITGMEEEGTADEGYPNLSVSQIQQAMNGLADGFRIVLTLYLFDGFTHSEIARQLGISEGTSKSQYMRAKLKLKELILDQHGEERST
ncbi:MAG: RNA polymerase sigma factor [Flavobacteriales bacterium]|nr:RNA polymerase sigma factor [Flavobacteriales bacterium]